MILLSAIICLQVDRLAVVCHQAVVRVEWVPADCVRMIEPVKAWLREDAAGFPVVFVEAQCRGDGLA